MWLASQTIAERWDDVMKRSVIHEKFLAEEKYTILKIVTLLKDVNLFSIVTSSKGVLCSDCS